MRTFQTSRPSPENESRFAKPKKIFLPKISNEVTNFIIMPKSIKNMLGIFHRLQFTQKPVEPMAAAFLEYAIKIISLNIKLEGFRDSMQWSKIEGYRLPSANSILLAMKDRPIKKDFNYDHVKWSKIVIEIIFFQWGLVSSNHL